MKTVFISGHLDLTEEEFSEHYSQRIVEAWSWDCAFVVGDARGADAMAQKLLKELNETDNQDPHDGLTKGLKFAVKVAVFHMFSKPRHNEGFETVGGFQTDDARDAAMTAASDKDIAWVRPGREKSGTAKNLARRR